MVLLMGITGIVFLILVVSCRLKVYSVMTLSSILVSALVVCGLVTACGNSESGDSTPPEVTAITPAFGANYVPITTDVSITFSEQMDAASTENAFSLRVVPSTVEVNGTFSWNGNVMTFSPSADLSYMTTYDVRVAATATDIAGNAPSDIFFSSFDTGRRGIYTMTEVDPSDKNYMDGKLYTVDTTLSEPGSYRYRFVFEDSNGMDAVGEPGGLKRLTVN
jgi:hypothetical protein